MRRMLPLMLLSILLIQRVIQHPTVLTYLNPRVLVDGQIQNSLHHLLLLQQRPLPLPRLRSNRPCILRYLTGCVVLIPPVAPDNNLVVDLLPV